MEKIAPPQSNQPEIANSPDKEKKPEIIQSNENEYEMSRRKFLGVMATAFSAAMLAPDKLANNYILTKTAEEKPADKTKKQSDNKFNTEFINETINKKPFVKTSENGNPPDSPAQKFFTKWCSMNDALVPKFISRSNWLKINEQNLRYTDKYGKTVLLIPEDIQLWEMMAIIREIDQCTFSSQPQLAEKYSDKITEAGKTFYKAGVYLREYLPEIEDGREIAEKMSREFSHYGLALQKGEKINGGIPQDIKLSDEEKLDLDRWFVGKSAFQKRAERLSEATPEEIDARRKKAIRAYFWALNKKVPAGAENNKKIYNKNFVESLQDNTKSGIIRQIKIPEKEMYSAVFRRGSEFLKNNLGFNKLLDVLADLENRSKHTPGLMTEIDIRNMDSLREIKPAIEFWQKQNYQGIYEALNIAELKADLEDVRQTGDAKMIANVEIYIAKRIIRVISRLPYEEGAHISNSSDTPSGIVNAQYINCVGASILGSSLENELGIKHLAATEPEHIFTLLVTSDKKVYLQDFLGSNANFLEIKDDDIVTEKPNRKKTTASDLVSLADAPSDEVINVKLEWTRGNKEPIAMMVTRPDLNLQYAMLNNIGNALSNIGKYKEAAEAYKQSVDFNPKEDTYIGLGNALVEIEKYEEALKAYEQYIILNKNDSKNSKKIKYSKKMIDDIKNYLAHN